LLSEYDEFENIPLAYCRLGQLANPLDVSLYVNLTSLNNPVTLLRFVLFKNNEPGSSTWLPFI
jgi:hypothetical protein